MRYLQQRRLGFGYKGNSYRAFRDGYCMALVESHEAIDVHMKPLHFICRAILLSEWKSFGQI